MYLAFWTLMALPPNQLTALQCRVVWEVTIVLVSVMIPLLQQGMLCNCKSRVLLPSAICFPSGMCPGTLGAPSLVSCLNEDWSLPFMHASAALPMGPHVAGDSHLV